MRKEKPFVGSKIRELRQQRGWTLEICSAQLGISVSYLSQLETNQRPLSSRTLMALLRTFDVDAAIFEPTVDLRLTSDLRDACASLTAAQDPVPISEIRRVAQGAPRFAREFLDLHRAYRKLDDRLKMVDQAMASSAKAEIYPILPYDEVSDFFHYKNNYIHELDLAAERLAMDIGLGRGPGLEIELEQHVRSRTDVGVARAPHDRMMRRLDFTSRTLTVNAGHPPETRAFQLAAFLASQELANAIEQGMGRAAFRSREAFDVCRVALTNYAAAALVMPYARFAGEARRLRHDVEQLATAFGVSLEQVCHRLSTLQRPSQRGVPLYFLRMDPAGNITKRHSATRFHFARFGGTCPLWNVHEAATTPDRFVVQLAETPDGVQYICVARAILKSSGAFGRQSRKYVLGFGCELTHASELVYSDELPRGSKPVPIGASCRTCERVECQHRAFPPLEGRIQVPADERSIVPFIMQRSADS